MGVGKSGPDAEAGVVDQHVNAAEMFHDGLDGGNHRAGIGDIAAQSQCLDALRPQSLGGGVHCLPVKIQHGHLCPGFSETTGKGKTDAAGRAGDHHHLMVEIAIFTKHGVAAPDNIQIPHGSSFGECTRILP